MKTYDELVARFADVADMPVSEETIGAYFEGNLTSDEMAKVESYLDDDAAFADFVADIHSDDAFIDEPVDDGMYDDGSLGEYAAASDDVYADDVYDDNDQYVEQGDDYAESEVDVFYAGDIDDQGIDAGDDSLYDDYNDMF